MGEGLADGVRLGIVIGGAGLQCDWQLVGRIKCGAGLGSEWWQLGAVLGK